MRILITNDDGIRGEGLRLLAMWARNLGEIVVCAPKSEKSACSQSIVLKRPFSCVRSDIFADLSIEAWEIDSTPADCVRFGLLKLGRFDLVLSGINNGFNTGHFINYSGTCGAAFEATAMGVPAVALSTLAGKLPEAAADLPRILKFFQERKLLQKHPLYNVNIAPGFRDFTITKAEPPFGSENFRDCGNGLYQASLDLSMWDNRELDISCDMEALFAGYCSVTPLDNERTAMHVYEELRS